ncbi:hypothetical protein HZS_5363 [Henneguya salminicola]|nr:hypothetical protein HZS_5363 [Henneguya salminicola]
MKHVRGEQYSTYFSSIPFGAFFAQTVNGIEALATLKMAVALDSRYKKLACLRREKHNAVRAVFYDRRQPT